MQKLHVYHAFPVCYCLCCTTAGLSDSAVVVWAAHCCRWFSWQVSNLRWYFLYCKACTLAAIRVLLIILVWLCVYDGCPARCRTCAGPSDSTLPCRSTISPKERQRFAYVAVDSIGLWWRSPLHIVSCTTSLVSDHIRGRKLFQSCNKFVIYGSIISLF